jgi:chromosomal replication initiation ATPase DnaA
MTERDLVEKIIAVLAKESGLEPTKFLKRTGAARELHVCKFRDDAIYLAREHTRTSGLSWEKLGVWFGARHHTTLIAAHRRVAERLKRNLPRRDKRTWAEWHEYIMERVKAVDSKVDKIIEGEQQ